MTRTQRIQAIIWIDQIIAAARAEGQKLREELGTEARDEFEASGTAPTWRIPDVATVAASVSHQSAAVTDERAFTQWAVDRYPTKVETVTRVLPGWLKNFLDSALVEGESAVDPQTGEIVPGLTVKPGGEFGGISIRATAAAKDAFGAVAGRALRQMALTAGPGVPVVLAELEARDADS